MVEMAVRVVSLSTAVRPQSMNLNGSQLPHSQNLNPMPRLSISKPSWVVQTESNVHREERIKPDPPCVVCSGTGRIDCHHCKGQGRTNCTDLEMLPKGEWPKWCKTCGGSGLGYCPRCLGTGEYRYIMGFQFMKRDESLMPKDRDNGAQSDQKHRSVADFYEE